MRDVKEFASDLAQRMAALGMSQGTLVRESGVSQASICHYLKGMAVPITSTLRELDAVLPGILDAWSDAVTEYQKRIKVRSVQTRRARKAAGLYKPHGESAEKGQPVNKSQPASKKKAQPSLVGPSGSLKQICRAARAEGMTYGQYVAAHSTRGGV